MNANIFKSAITEESKKAVMKDLLRIIVVAALLLSVQNALAQISYGVKLGGNLSTMKFKGKTEINDNDIKMRPGFCVGIFINERPEGSIFSLESGINIETKGYNYKTEKEVKVSGAKGKASATGSVNIVYATIPVDVRLNLGGFYLMAGPYCSVGITGKSSSNVETTVTVRKKTTTESESNSRDLDFESDFKRVDAGVNFGIGETIGKIGIRFNYDLGLLNILQSKGNKYDATNEATNRTLSCAITCHF